MTGRAFLDTNVLVYAHDARDAGKRHIARDLLVGRDPATLALSTQVLQEFYATVTRRLTPAVPGELAREAVRQLGDLRLVRPNAAMIIEAGLTSETAQISFWDALIVRAAVVGGCDRILTEDLNAGQTIDGVLIENPFAA